MKHVVVVGGGIAGLATAYALRGKARVTIVEPDVPGGTIRTIREDGFLVEGGPDSFITAKPEGTALCRELGLGDQLIPPSVRKVYVLSRGKLHPLPEGMFLTVPTKIWPMLTSGLISWTGKMRMGMEFFLPRGGGGDESIGAFVRRRFGDEAVAKIAEPLMGGIFVAEADRLSLRATFPRFAEMEEKHRSLIRAMRKIPVTGQSPLLSLRGGMGALVEALLARIDAAIVRAEAKKIEPGYRVVLSDGAVEADAVVVATPPPVTVDLVRAWPELAAAIARVPCETTATVSLGYRAADMPRPLDASGFVIPKAEKRRILACTWCSSKFEGRAPDGSALLRCFFVGSPPDPAGVAREELREILGIVAEPVLTKTYLWPGANPIYEVGHQDRVAEIEARTPVGMVLTGSGYRGIGIPGCIADAKRTADRIVGNG
ncbi:MAG: protoporphyrinogen oxidase [Planctomycetes bacterium]|nr:protoporphyrinogen oxidase [Planctomycetota bacterium]